MLWQVIALLKPENVKTTYVYSAFTVNSFLIWFLVYRSYKKNANMSTTVYPAYVLFVIRQLLRLADIDD